MRSGNADGSRIHECPLHYTGILAFGETLDTCNHFLPCSTPTWRSCHTHRLEGAAHYTIQFCLWPQMAETDVDNCTKLGQSKGYVNIGSRAGRPGGLGF